MNRKEAIVQGSRFYDGKPCKFGHGTLKYLKGSSCVQCTKDKAKTHQVENREKYLSYQKENRLLHLSERKEKSREWYRANATRVLDNAKRWKLNNPERKRQLDREWEKRNKSYCRAKSADNLVRRYRLIAGQTIAKSFSKEIREIYLNCPEGHHVDHIVPLRATSVNGLHVPWNLQYLPALENLRKGNRLETEK